MALDLVSDYIAEARVLLQDTFAGSYRYADAEMISALNLGLLEASRLRPDMFLTTVPSYTTAGQTVAVDLRYRVALLYYICAHCHMRDEETTEDTRAGAFLGKFNAHLLTLQA